MMELSFSDAIVTVGREWERDMSSFSDPIVVSNGLRNLIIRVALVELLAVVLLSI